MALRNNVALVTGASSGIGKHIAKTLFNNGASVILAARRLEKLESLANELNSSPTVFENQVATPMRMDITNDSLTSIKASLETLTAQPINILVNNAGIGLDKPALSTTSEDYDTVMNTNVRGPFLLSTLVANQMDPENNNNTIINIGSIAGFLSPRNLSLYGASKAALHHLTKSLASELARRNVRVNAIAPGYISTDINAAFFKAYPKAKDKIISAIPQRRIGDVTELDGILMLLADSRKSSFITGAVVPVDGGHSSSV